MADGGVTITVGADAPAELVERLRAAFPDADFPPPDAAPAYAVAEEAMATAVAAADRFPDLLAAWWTGLSGDGPLVLAVAAGAPALAYGVERALRRPDREPAEGETDAAPFTARAARAGRWALGRAAGLILFTLVAVLIFRVAAPGGDGGRALLRAVLGAALYARFIASLIDLVAAPGAPQRRLMGFDAAEAGAAARAGFAAAAALFAVGLLRAPVLAAAAGSPAATLPLILLAALSALASAWLFLAVRRPVRALLLRTAGERPGRLPRLAATHWAALYLALIALDASLRVAGLLGLFGEASPGGAGPSLLVLALAPLAIAGLRVWRSEAAPTDGLRVGLFALGEGAVALVAGLLLLRIWGVDPLDREAEGLAALAPALVKAAVIVTVGLALWRAAVALLTAAPRSDTAEPGEEGGGSGGSRLETALPVLRGFILAVIGVTTAMTALSTLGVNIAPLLASAGVIGLAVGFGAQRLVSDVISGLFYLYEDALRVGEYIETGSGKGVVEKISLRSVRLRHPRGPVFTIPFSAMGTVQNHSRDWVTMKFTFSVPSDVDLEVVRKLVKRTGEEMLSDPELEGKILAPLKSQGALRIIGRSYEVGCKFTARPGQQFVIRRKAYAALQKALAAKGIDLFAPQLTVATGDPTRPLSAGEPEAVAAR